MADWDNLDDPVVWELGQRLNRLGVDPATYSLEGGLPNECTCLGRTWDHRWSIYFCERGRRREEALFDDVADACEEFARRLGI